MAMPTQELQPPPPAVPDLPLYPLSDDVRAALGGVAHDGDILFIGEIHGTREVPGVLASLVPALTPLGYRVLALEMSLSVRETLVAWADGAIDRPPAAFTQGSGDGRNSAEVLGLVRAVRRAGWDVWCFDATPEQWQGGWADRDRGYADSLAGQYRAMPGGTRVLALCGNLHSRLFLRDGDPDRHWPSCAANLSAVLTDRSVRSVCVWFHGGSFFGGSRNGIMPSSPWPWGEGVTAATAPSTWGHTLDLHLRACTPATIIGWTGPQFVVSGLRSGRFATDPPGAERPMTLVSVRLASFADGDRDVTFHLTPKRRIAAVEQDSPDAPAVVHLFDSLQQATQAMGDGGTQRYPAAPLERAARALAELEGKDIPIPAAASMPQSIEYVDNGDCAPEGGFRRGVPW